MAGAGEAKSSNKRRRVYITDEDYKRAANNGIDAKVLYHRVNRWGMEKEEAITKPLRKYGVWADVAELNGIGKGTFYSRVNLRGINVVKAATTPINKKERVERARKSRQIEGEEEEVLQALREGRAKNKVLPQEWIDKAKENGVSAQLLRWRLEQGKTVEEATTFAPGELPKKKRG